jgi:hypothetical protein
MIAGWHHLALKSGMIAVSGFRGGRICFGLPTCYRQAMTTMISKPGLGPQRQIARAARGAAAAVALCWLVTGPALADKIKHPTAVFAGLDKITGRIIAFDVAIDETVQFGTLEITPRACFTRPATEAPLTTGFAEVDEVTTSNEYRRIFSGWMFADSPGLHGVEHPVYDVWLTDCKGGTEVIHEAVADAPAEDLSQPMPKPGTRPRATRQVTPVDPVPLAPSAPAPAAPPPAARSGAVTSAPLPPSPSALPGSAGGPPLPTQQFQPRSNPNALIPPADIGAPPIRR